MPLVSKSVSEPRNTWYWQLGLVLAPIVAAYLVLARFYTATPIIDDYVHIFPFALQFHNTAGSFPKLALLLTTQVGPYKLIFDHFLVSLQLLLLGHLNFPLMILLGNLTPLGIFALLWNATPTGKFPPRYRLLLLLPISLLLFSLNYAETLNWAISGLQQPAVILFSLASIYFLVEPSQTGRAFILACVFALLASITYANGMIVWPVGLLFLLLRERRLSRWIGWTASFVAMLAVYLYRYHPDAPAALTPLWQKPVFFAMFCGGALENMHHRPVPYISFLIGIAVLAVFAHAIRTRYDRRNAFFFFSAIWILLTAAVVTASRVGMGLQLSLSSRYKIYCDLLLIFCYEYLLDRFVFSRKARQEFQAPARFLYIAAAAALFVNIASDWAGAHFLATRRDRANAAMRRYIAAPNTASPMFLVEDQLSPEEMAMEEQARKVLSQSIHEGIYTPPK